MKYLGLLFAIIGILMIISGAIASNIKKYTINEFILKEVIKSERKNN